LLSSCCSTSFDLHPRSTLRAVACRHGGGCCAVRRRCGGPWLLAPGPPCERVLAVVGDGCSGAISLLPRTLVVDTTLRAGARRHGWVPCHSASLLSIPGTVFLFLLWWGGVICWHRPMLLAPGATGGRVTQSLACNGRRQVGPVACIVRPVVVLVVMSCRSVHTP
jgi:hypothetical protein